MLERFFIQTTDLLTRYSIPKSMLYALMDKIINLVVELKVSDLESYRVKNINNVAETALNLFKDSVPFRRTIKALNNFRCVNAF
jgi:galactitol-specific phosphotransferase system IIC component